LEHDGTSIEARTVWNEGPMSKIVYLAHLGQEIAKGPYSIQGAIRYLSILTTRKQEASG